MAEDRSAAQDRRPSWWPRGLWWRETTEPEDEDRPPPPPYPRGQELGAATPSLRDLSARIERARRYPRGMVDSAITALEAARPDTKEGGAVRRAVDDALDRLYRFREVETGETHGS